MEKWLTSYLLEFKSCPLPSVGSLVLQQGQARLLPGDKKILAPIPSLGLYDKEISSYGLTGYLSRQQDISINDAAAQLSAFCSRLQQLQENEELPLHNIGIFYREDQNVLRFKSIDLPAAFLPSVTAERVVHPDASHDMIVGSRETNTAAMTELLNEEPEVRSRWWIAALILAGIGIAIIVVWALNDPQSDFGNSTNITPKTASPSYQPTKN